MSTLFYRLPQNVRKIFWGYNIVFHILAILLTYLIVRSGLDWTYHTFFRHSVIYPFFFLGAGILGFILPVFVPLSLLAIGKIRQNKQTINTAWAMGQAAMLGLLISWFYKVFTGRSGPEIMVSGPLSDISHVFRFGILRGGIFWGWPSSQTMIVVSVAVTLIFLYPKNKKIIISAALIALYIGFGASISFHWFSDCLAGTLIGTVIGITVGRSFKARFAFLN